MIGGKKMIKYKYRSLLIFLILFVLFLFGCSTTTKTFPKVYTNNISTEFEILGTIFIRSTSNVGYNTVFEESKKKYPSTDYVIDIMIDEHEIITSYHWFTHFIKTIFGTSMKKEQIRYEYTIRGTAIQYIRRDINGEIISISTPSATSTVSPVNIINVVSEIIDSNRNSVNNNVDFMVKQVAEKVQRKSGDNWVDVKNKDILKINTIIRINSSGTLTILDGKNNSIIISVKTDEKGLTIEELISMHE